jgi:hypothetical protein
MFLLFIVINFVSTNNDIKCSLREIPACIKEKHTDLYLTKWKEIGNKNNYFYHPFTFGINVAKDPCAPVDLKRFLAVLNEKKCNGEWCINNKFGQCGKGGQNCYQMEHIFDKNGCDYTTKETEIWANVVMAYGNWNSQVSNCAMKGCTNTLNEKIEIYGKTMIDTIRNRIELCSKKAHGFLPSGQNGPPPHKRNDENNSHDEFIDGFDYSECDISCTCESNKYLDILCGCDYSETDFDPSLCVVSQSPLSGSKIVGSISFIVIGVVIGFAGCLLAFISGYLYKYAIENKYKKISDIEVSSDSEL